MAGLIAVQERAMAVMGMAKLWEGLMGYGELYRCLLCSRSRVHNSQCKGDLKWLLSHGVPLLQSPLLH